MVDVRAVYKGNSPMLEATLGGCSCDPTREIAIRSQRKANNLEKSLHIGDANSTPQGTAPDTIEE